MEMIHWVLAHFFAVIIEQKYEQRDDTVYYGWNGSNLDRKQLYSILLW